MVLRRDQRGALAIGQPAHAWLCGQLARAWGNARFGEVTPLPEVALAAEQHDVGMAAWDLRPTRDPVTGLPQSFIEMDTGVNVSLWRDGPVRLLTQSRYAALLATMHGRRLYERHDLSSAPPPLAAAITAFLGEARALESQLVAALRADPQTAPHAGDDVVERNSRLVWIWDTISLALLLDWAPLTLTAVPVACGQPVDVSMSAGRGDGPLVASLAPWPFGDDAVVALHCEGRRLSGGCASQAELDDALAGAPWETLRFELVAGDASEDSRCDG